MAARKRLVAVIAALVVLIASAQSGAFALAASGNTTELVASMTLDQPMPIVLGQTVTFTEVYPHEAATSKQNPQYPENPLTEVVCYQNGVIIWANITAVDSKTNVHLGNGWTRSTTAPMTIGGPSGVFIGSAAYWDTGAANCLALLFSWTTVKQLAVQTIWATTTFDVVP